MKERDTNEELEPGSSDPYDEIQELIRRSQEIRRRMGFAMPETSTEGQTQGDPDDSQNS
jgi:hypothetical protein